MFDFQGFWIENFEDFGQKKFFCSSNEKMKYTELQSEKSSTKLYKILIVTTV